MADKQPGGGFGITGNVAASLLLSVVVSLAVRLLGPKFAQWELQNLSDNTWTGIAAGAILFVQALWWGIRFFVRRTASAAKTIISRAKSSGDKLCIVVATLEGDDGNQTRHVIESLEQQFGHAVEVLHDSAVIKIDTQGNVEAQKQKAEAKARDILRKAKGDVLIYGSGFAAKPVVALHFVIKDESSDGSHRYALDDILLLPKDFGTELGAQIAVVAATSAAPAFDTGHYVVDLLKPAVERLQHLIDNPPANLGGRDRAWLLHSFAIANKTIGEQSGSTAHLEIAIKAFRDVLKDWTRKSAPLLWAMTQNNLGTALQALGSRESDTTRLEEAVTAYREALKEYTRERVPLQWATTQNNLGNALSTLGERESGTNRLEEAVTAYRAALQERTRERVPLQWATTQNNLGNALSILGKREDSTARLEEAVTAYREALKEYARAYVPLNWATTQNNLGNALWALGSRESGTAWLQEAVTAYREALQERTRERVPLDWAMTQNNLGGALWALGARENDPERLEEAIAAYQLALIIFREADAGYYVEGTARNLARAEALLAERRG